MNDIKSFQGNQSLVNNPTAYATTRAKSFKVKASDKDYLQYVNTLRAYASAGLPFEHIANAGDFLGDSVERGELDAPIEQGWQEKVGEVAEDENKILAWQNRGEVISIAHQLSAKSTTGEELVSISQSLSKEADPKQTLNVVEGITVIKKEPQTIQNSTSSDAELENNPYLQPIQDQKKIS